MSTLLQLVITPERREGDAAADVARLAAKHSVAVRGEYPAYQLALPDGVASPPGAFNLPESVLALLVDLSYSGAIRNVAIARHDGVMPDGAVLQRLQIDDFLAAHRRGGIATTVWYRIHAPAGYRCRP